MTDPLSIAEGEQGVVRIAQLSDPLAKALAAAATLDPLARALGVASLDPDHVQIVALRDLNDLGLAGLLEQGHGIAGDTLAQDSARLARLGGTVAILRSRAFGPGPNALAPRPDCKVIAAYRDSGAPPPRLDPLQSGSAKGNLGGGSPAASTPDHHASRRTLLIGVAAAGLLALVVLLLSRGTG